MDPLGRISLKKKTKRHYYSLIVSSSLNEAIRTIFSLFNFFLREMFEHNKTQTNDFHRLGSFCASKILLPLLFSLCFAFAFLLVDF